MSVRNVFYFSKKVRLFSQNDVLFLFYFLINPTMTTANYKTDGLNTFSLCNSNQETNKIIVPQRATSATKIL